MLLLKLRWIDMFIRLWNARFSAWTFWKSLHKNFICRQNYRQIFLEIRYITLIIATMTLMEEICGKCSLVLFEIIIPYLFFVVIQEWLEMLSILKKLKCRKCPYHLGLIKFTVNPCLNCKVYGGKNSPPKLDFIQKWGAPMGILTIDRNLRRCVLCRYWNGAIGSTTIQVHIGGSTFSFESSEKHSCFKKGRGMVTTAIQECPYFLPRYYD